MPEWLLNILISEFVWGILAGILLTTYGAFLTISIQKSNQEAIVKNFCKDSLSNISKFIVSMDDHKDRSLQIHHDFIGFIELELQVYGRNREHLTQISNESLRQEIRDLYNDIAINLLRLKQNLSGFYEFQRLAKLAQTSSSEFTSNNEQSLFFLNKANVNFDKLVSLKNSCKDIIVKI